MAKKYKSAGIFKQEGGAALKTKSKLRYLSADKKREKLYHIIDSLQYLKIMFREEPVNPLLYWEFQHIADVIHDEIITIANLYD